MLTIKTTKSKGAERVCPQKDCGFSEPYDAPADTSPAPDRTEPQSEVDPGDVPF